MSLSRKHQPFVKSSHFPEFFCLVQNRPTEDELNRQRKFFWEVDDKAMAEGL